MTTTFAKTMFHVGPYSASGYHLQITPATLRRMALRFQALRRAGLLVPVYDDHYAGSRPLPAARIRRLALADRRLQGFVSGMQLTRDGKALKVAVTFLRRRGRDQAHANRMSLSPVLDCPTVQDGGEMLGQLQTIDLVDRAADKTQTPFVPVLRTVRNATRSTPSRPGVKRMSEMKMPLLNDAQMAVLKKLNDIRQHVGGGVDWWQSALKMLWPDQATEILGNDDEEAGGGTITETSPEFAALSLHGYGAPDPHVYDEPSRQSRIDSGDPELIAAKKFVDEQAKRMPHTFSK